MLKFSLKFILLFLLVVPTFAQTPEPIIGEAFVNTVEVTYAEDGIVLTIRGDLPDSCTELGEISQSIDGENVTITVSTQTPPDVMCAQVLTPFETSYSLDTSELESGLYQLNVNGIMAELVIDPTACPEAEDGVQVYDEQGLCFLYPEDYSEISGDGFILISQVMSDAALIVIDIQAAEEDDSLELLAADFEGDTFIVKDSRLGGQEALIVDDSESEIRLAYVLFEDKLYSFSVQPYTEAAGGEALWESFAKSLFFDGSEGE